jgi:hypothetical protein
VNLNGLWDYSVISRDQSQPQSIDGKILVPFPIESALSGVMRTVTDQEQICTKKHSRFRKIGKIRKSSFTSEPRLGDNRFCK